MQTLKRNIILTCKLFMLFKMRTIILKYWNPSEQKGIFVRIRKTLVFVPKIQVVPINIGITERLKSQWVLQNKVYLLGKVFFLWNWRRYCTFEQFCWFLFNWNLEKFPDFSVNFEGEKMVDQILEIPRLEVFCVKFLYWNTTKNVFT